MNKTKFLTLSGLTMLLGGLTILFSAKIGIETSKIITPILFIISGICSILFAKNNKKHLLAKNFHLLQGLGMIAFAIAIVFIPNSLESFLIVVTFFTMAYGLIEILFTFSVLNSSQKIDMNILMIRIITGTLNLIGGFALFISAIGKNLELGVSIAGVLISIAGISFIIFSNKIKA